MCLNPTKIEDKFSGFQVLAAGPGGRKARPYDTLLNLLGSGEVYPRLPITFLLVSAQRGFFSCFIHDPVFNIQKGVTFKRAKVRQFFYFKF